MCPRGTRDASLSAMANAIYDGAPRLRWPLFLMGFAVVLGVVLSAIVMAQGNY